MVKNEAAVSVSEIRKTPKAILPLDLADRALEAAIDSSSEIERVIDTTPKDGYALKLNLIANADDMPTFEKLKAIEAAETKYSQDVGGKVILPSLGKDFFTSVGKQFFT